MAGEGVVCVDIPENSEVGRAFRRGFVVEPMLEHTSAVHTADLDVFAAFAAVLYHHRPLALLGLDTANVGVQGADRGKNPVLESFHVELI